MVTKGLGLYIKIPYILSSENITILKFKIKVTITLFSTEFTNKLLIYLEWSNIIKEYP